MGDSKKFWNSQAKNFDSNDTLELSELVEASKIYLKSDMSVLDFGCATGSSTQLLANYVDNVLGLDYSEEMIDYANKKNHKNNTTFIVGSIFSKQLNQEKYDVIIAYNVLHLVDDLDEVLHRMSRLLKPKGFIISSTAVLGEKKNILSFIIRVVSKIGMFPSVISFSVKKIRKKFTDRGFSIVASKLNEEKVPNLFLVVKKESKSKTIL